LEVPFFLLQGESDVITLTSLAEEYFEEVEAPTKGLALINDAAPLRGVHPAAAVSDRTPYPGPPTGGRAQSLGHAQGVTGRP
jgi:hypothetical protein